jgi:hypothetical protein
MRCEWVLGRFQFWDAYAPAGLAIGWPSETQHQVDIRGKVSATSQIPRRLWDTEGPGSIVLFWKEKQEPDRASF